MPRQAAAYCSLDFSARRMTLASQAGSPYRSLPFYAEEPTRPAGNGGRAPGYSFLPPAENPSFYINKGVFDRLQHLDHYLEHLGKLHQAELSIFGKTLERFQRLMLFQKTPKAVKYFKNNLTIMNETLFAESGTVTDPVLRIAGEEQARCGLADADERAFTRLHGEHYSSLFYYGLKLSGDEELVKDCIQELFIDLWENRARLGGIRSFKFYLQRSLRYIILRKVNTSRKRTVRLESFHDVQFDTARSHEEFLAARETSSERNRQVTGMLDKLASRQKEIIYMKYYQDLEYQEIAKILSINYQSVINHIYKAFQALRKQSARQPLKCI